jgi:hypothetical protein
MSKSPQVFGLPASHPMGRGVETFLKRKPPPADPLDSLSLLGYEGEGVSSTSHHGVVGVGDRMP